MKKSKAPKVQQQHQQQSSLNSICTLIILTPVVILFFSAGIFVGSKFVDTKQPAMQASSSGLPRTNNNLAKWVSQQPNLRSEPLGQDQSIPVFRMEPPRTQMDPPIVQVNLRTGSIQPSQGQDAVKPIRPLTSLDLSTVLKSSLHATRRAFMRAPSNLDAANVLAGAWIYLSRTSNDNDMRTIFTNKQSGCEHDFGRYGFSMYVNAWQTNDHRLYVEYGGLRSGCNKLESSIQLQPEKWYHVAMYLGQTSASLFVDGTEVGSLFNLEPHQIQLQRSMVVGQYEGGEYAFDGNISCFAVFHLDENADVSSKDNIAKLVKEMMDVKDLSHKGDGGVAGVSGATAFASYPLTDAADEITDVDAVDLVAGHNGRYKFPVKGRNVEGVSIELVDGVGGRPVTEEMKQQSEVQGRLHRDKIKAAMAHVWKSYKKYAWGRDELKPLSLTGQDNWGGMGVTLVDSLDTLWLMGMKEEFNDAKEWVKSQLTFGHATTVSVFETTIRELGGLLAAFDLSGDKVFLQRAKELGELLEPAFNTRTGIAQGMVSFPSHSAAAGWAGDSAILSELGTLQVEFRYLAHHTKTLKFETESMKALQLMRKRRPQNGLFPIKVSFEDGSFTDSHITFGALGDSFYEYLLKVWIQGGKKEKWLRDMYDEAMDGVMNVLLQTSSQTGLAFLADWDGMRIQRKMDHLVCFMPGLLTLGAFTDPTGVDSKRAKRDIAVAKALMYTCREMYNRQVSKISPEYVEFPIDEDMVPSPNAPFYILRPETAESLFVMNHLLGDPIYREWAWEIWEAIDKHCSTEHGFGALRDVRNPSLGVDDRMESFFLAETIKYLFLATDPDQPIDLTKYVFNTEAHPLKILDDSHKPIME